MIIFVNATAASEIGGLKTIVDQFIDGINYYDNKNKYYVFVNPQYNHYNEPSNCQLIRINMKKPLKRLYWDYNGIKKWSIKNNLIPDKIISLQNTGVIFKNVEQIIYLHTPIPFVDYNWNFFKKDERRLWFYKYVYPYIIKTTLNEKTIFVVQSNWLKKRVSKFFNIPQDRLIVNVPSIFEEITEKNSTKLAENTSDLYFYPAADYKYKNHKIIIEALKLLKKNNTSRYSKIKIIFTLEKNSNIYKLALNAGVSDRVLFIGKLDKIEMGKMYQKSKAILFPSYIETFGLPLIEAASFGKTIYCSREEYSKEVISEYEGVKFLNPFDVSEWEKIFSEDYRWHNTYTNNQNFESWSEFFRRINYGI